MNELNSAPDRATVPAELARYVVHPMEVRHIPATYLRFALKKKRGDGVKAFVGVDPDSGQPLGTVPEPSVPSLPCFLHPEHPERAKLVEMGIGMDLVCGGHETKPARFLTEFDRGRHEQSKHRHSFAIREKHMVEQRERESRERQERATDAMIALAGGKTCGGRLQAPRYRGGRKSGTFTVKALLLPP